MSTVRLRHHGLISVSAEPGLVGIYWLRLFTRVGRAIAVVTEVPGNPGPAVVNGMDEIRRHLAEKFGVDLASLLLFDIWPSGWTGDSASASVHRISRVGDDIRWSTSARTEIESLVGGPLPDLPTHSDLLRAVLDIGGRATAEAFVPRYVAFPTADLPPGQPFRCVHYPRLTEILREIGCHGDDPAAHGAARSRFRDSLTPDDLAVCPYHRGDWLAIADASVAVIEGMESQPLEAYRTRAELADLALEDRRRLRTLFSEPIQFGANGYIGGQHRACALYFSRASRVAVLTGWDSAGDVPDVWIYGGDG